MTISPRHVWLYRLATWSRTRPWPRPSGQEQCSVGGRLLGGGRCADVVRGILPHLAMDPCWFGQLQNVLQEAVWEHSACDDSLGTDGGEMWPGVDRDVTLSGRPLFVRSTRCP